MRTEPGTKSVGGVVELTLEVQCREDRPILSCQGHLICGDESEALLAAVCRLLANAERVSLHLGELTKIDCAGLGALVASFNAARQRGRLLELCSVPPRIRTMLDLTGLQEVLCPKAIGSSVGIQAA